MTCTSSPEEWLPVPDVTVEIQGSVEFALVAK
jgi:hypothetical protein